MKVTIRKRIAGSLVTLSAVALIFTLTRPPAAQSRTPVAVENEPIAEHQSAQDRSPVAAREVAPFIVVDTDNDSPGTNFVTRIVTFTAEIGGTPSPDLQWKVDQGAGFADIPGATNATYRIGNAQVGDSGLYALFATNAAGAIITTPQSLIVIEGED